MKVEVVGHLKSSTDSVILSSISIDTAQVKEPRLSTYDLRSRESRKRKIIPMSVEASIFFYEMKVLVYGFEKLMILSKCTKIVLPFDSWENHVNGSQIYAGRALRPKHYELLPIRANCIAKVVL